MRNGLRINSSGDKIYYENDFLHRINGPAVECVNGDKFWYQNDQLHREDGSAVEWEDGYKVWYIQGQKIDCTTQEQFEKLMRLKAFW